MVTVARSLWVSGKPALGKLRHFAHELHSLALPLRRNRKHALPDAVIIGAQRCGTTSLYHCISQHPRVIRPSKKEVHYFDINYHRDLAWYQMHFQHNHGKLNFEASPYYIFHPKAPERVAAALPDTKVIVILRDPVARAYSHYWHERRLGNEKLSFAEAIDAEGERLAGESTRLAEEDGYYSYNHHHFSYVSRGCYDMQLKRWLRFFPRPQFLFIESESFFEDPGREMARVTRFLKLPPLGDTMRMVKENAGTYPEDIAPALRRHLRARFANANRELEALTKTTWRWNC